MNSLVSGAITKLWGNSPTDFYAVGRSGTIIHFDGHTWQKLQSGTTLDITDIYGASNPKTGELEILAVASNRDENFDRQILKIRGTTVTTLSDSGTLASLSGVWFVPGQSYYVAGLGFYQKANLMDTSPWLHILWGGYSIYYQAVRGNGSKDFVVACIPGGVYHFDGYWWTTFPEASLGDGSYNSVAMRGNLVVAVGLENWRSVVAIGKRARP